ncbi:MAG TPA: A/G-specific adenine glycosylase [Terriglobales bacterium]|nr:A/G-specific adenine glycosylase [Terriglobales bacterium]
MKPPAELQKAEQRRVFRRRLLRWFCRNRRRLPWRADRDPYRVWLSEIMLQQTRVAVVRERYPDFLARFPTLESLAAAKIAEVLAAWSGLGYYRRARALHAAARQIVERGGFPRTAEELTQLPGIGRYTAAAIASIAFDQPCAVVDGNVERVLGRLLPVRKQDLWRAAGELLHPRRPGDFNQAIMELGAMVCLPKAPLCDQCPVLAWCRTRGMGPSRARSLRRKRSIAYRLIIRNQTVFLVRRGDQKSLMPGMWELPQMRPAAGAPALRLRHAITNTDYQVNVYRTRAANGAAGRWVRLAAVERLPLTGLTRKILRRANLI